MGGVAVTLNTRYERLCVEHFMSLAHFPRIGVKRMRGLNAWLPKDSAQGMAFG